MSRMHMFVDVIVKPSRRVMCSGFDVGCLSIIGALGSRKCPLVPKSKIPWT